MDAKFLEYNCLDSACMVEAHNEFWPEISPDFQATYDLTIDLLDPILFMQTRGIRVNMAEMDIVKAEILQTAAAKQEELNQLCGRDLNVNSSKDCQQYFYIELGIAPYYNDGKVTVDDSALQRLSRGTAKRPGLRQAKLAQDIRGLQKLYGTYLNIEFDSDSRLRCSYNPRGTKFGRLSSSKTVFGTGTNQQNLPQEFKRFLVADEGYVLWEVDKRQAEWVVMAYLTGDANMISVVEQGKDTHVHTASLMFDVDPEVVELENKLVGMNSDPDLIASIREGDEFLKRFCANFPRTMSGRQCGKKSNHGLNYDEGYSKFALINEIEQSDAKHIVEMYHQIYPGIRVWYEWIKRTLQKDRQLTNYFGRRVRFMDQWGMDLWKSAYSMLPQSTVVDSLNKGMCEIYHDDYICGASAYNIDLLAQVHDSILLQIPVKTFVGLHPAFQQERMQTLQDKVYNYVSPEISYNNRSFKIATDQKIGLNWGGISKTNPGGMREVKSLTEAIQLWETLGVRPN